MALRQKVLQKKAAKFELRETRTTKVKWDLLSEFKEILDDNYISNRPKATDYQNRRELVRVFNDMAKEIFGDRKGCPVVVEFGSFTMDLFTSGSDLDVSINFNNKGGDFPREKQTKTLRKFAKKLYALQKRGHVSGVSPILSAKVPILKCVDCGTGIECDLSVENRDGVLKSQIVYKLSSIDERFPKLSFLMKTWAKAHNINSSKDRTLNSLSIILLVALHLQTRDPPILPPFSAVLKDGTDPSTVEKSLKAFQNFGKKSTESVAELFFSLLIKLASVEKLWPKGICASAYQGSWISKTWDSNVACMSVEDFTDRSQNVARAVGKQQVEDIYKNIRTTIRQVSAFLEGKIRGPTLKDCLFGNMGKLLIPTEPVQALPVVQQKSAKRHWEEAMDDMPENHQLSKRISSTDGWGGALPKTWGWNSTRDWGEPAREGWGGNPTGFGGWTNGARSQQTGISEQCWGGQNREDSGRNRVKGWGRTQDARLQETSGVKHTKGWGWALEDSRETRPLAKVWGGPNREYSEGNHVEGWGRTQDARLQETFGAKHTKGWGWALEDSSQETQPLDKVWGGNSTRSWGWALEARLQEARPLEDGWGGNRAAGWGGRQVAQPQKTRSSGEGWGRWQHQPPISDVSQNRSFGNAASYSNHVTSSVQSNDIPPYMLPGFNGSNKVV